MSKGDYLKLIALSVDGFEASILDDKNVKNIGEACDYFQENYGRNRSTAMWLILPCSYTIND